MVRASSRQQKASEAETAPAQLNGHSNDTNEMMDTEPIKITAKQSRTTKVTKELNNAAKIIKKRKASLPSSPEQSAPKRGRKRQNASDEAQPVSKRTKVSSSPAVAQVQLSAPSISGGVVLAVGMGDIGQLGMGPDVEEKTRCQLVPDLPANIVSISAGGLHTACIDSQGKVHTWGCNDEGALGRATSCDEENFSAGCVEGIEEKVVQITTGDCHTAALTENGTVYAWGSFRDNNGPLGFLERNTLQKAPRVVPCGGEPVVQIASGNNHLALLTHSGRLYTCGCGESGQLGRIAEMFANRNSRNRNGFDVLLIPSVVKVYRARHLVLFDGVWAGGDNTFARDTATGHIYAWGLNNYNQIGDSDTNTKFQPVFLKSIKDKKWKQFTCGQHHGLALESTGAVYCMGRHDYGRLGLGEDHKKDAITPELIPKIKDHTVNSISAAGCVSLVVADNGDAYGFGMGTSNQLSQGDEEDRWEPTKLIGKQLAERKVLSVSVGGQHTVVLAAAKE